MSEEQDFEIIALNHPDYLERIKAVDEIEDFSVLEEIFITDDYITVKMKAYDRLTELYKESKRYNKMIKNWRDITGFNGWIHFIISELGRGNNIEKTIRFILEQRGYKFKEFYERLDWIKKEKKYKQKDKQSYGGWMIEKTRNQIFQKVVDVALMPIKIPLDDTYTESWNKEYYYKITHINGFESYKVVSPEGNEMRSTQYGYQYRYEMVIKILVEKENGILDHDYIFIRCWNTHPDIHLQFYKKNNYMEDEN